VVEPEYNYIDKEDSIAQITTTASTVSGGNLVASFVLSPGGSLSIPQAVFSDVIKLDQTQTIAMRVTSGGSSEMSVSEIWEEDV
jgi:hypothetical protein